MFYNLPVFGSPEYQASIKPWKDAVTGFEKAKAEVEAFAQAHPTPTKIPDVSDTSTIIPSDSPLWGGNQKDLVEIRCVGGIQPTAKEGRNLMYQGPSALQILTLTPLVLIDRSAHQ